MTDPDRPTKGNRITIEKYQRKHLGLHWAAFQCRYENNDPRKRIKNTTTHNKGSVSTQKLI